MKNFIPKMCFMIIFTVSSTAWSMSKIDDRELITRILLDLTFLDDWGKYYTNLTKMIETPIIQLYKADKKNHEILHTVVKSIQQHAGIVFKICDNICNEDVNISIFMLDRTERLKNMKFVLNFAGFSDIAQKAIEIYEKKKNILVIFALPLHNNRNYL